jgi:diadenosine tetraphosphate (Ap4A) HIT family hydrolase
VAEPTQLDEDGAAGYWRDVLTTARAIETRFDPMKINLLTLGNWVPHLHTHVVPRYRNDPAPGGPIAYEAMFGQEPTAIETLRGHVDSIRGALPR